MIGTTWLHRTVQTFSDISRSLKALPQPGELYRTQQAPMAYPLTFPGWEQVEKEKSGVAKDLANAKTAVNSTAVFADVQAIAKEFSSAELIAKRRGADGAYEDVEEHPLEALWTHPNAHMGRSYLMEFWAWSYVLLGKAYLYWIPAGGQIREVWPVPSFMLMPDKDDKQFVSGYLFKSRPDARPIPIPAEYITFSRSVNPFDPMDGMSFLVAALTSIRGDIAASQWNLNFFADNNGVPDGMISVSRDTLDVDLMKIRSEIRDFFGGTRRGVAVARAGEMDYKPFGRTQKDAEFLEGRRFAGQEIGRTLGFPDGYWSESANRANAEQARATMIAGAVWPLLVRLAEDLNAQFVGRWYGEDDRVEFKDIRPEDRQLKLAELAAYKDFMPIGRLLKRIGEEPLGDVRDDMLVAEVVKGMPIATTPAANEIEDQQQAEQEEQAAEAPPEAAPAEGESMPPEASALPEGAPVKAVDLRLWETKALNTLRKKGRATCVFKSETIAETDRIAISQALADCRTPSEVRAVFGPFSVKAADPSTHSTSSGQASSGQAPRAAAEAALKQKLAAILAKAGEAAATAIENGDEPDTAALSAALQKELHAALVDAMAAGVSQQAVALGVKPTGINAAPWAKEYVPGQIKDIDQTTRDDIARVVAKYRETPGMTRQDVVDALEGTFGAARADMIATTEITAAQSQASRAVNEYLKDNGLDYEFVWRVSNDDRQCPECTAKADTVVLADDLPPLHPRCRCFVTQRLKK